MGKKKKFPKGQPVFANVFFAKQKQSTFDAGYSSDDEREEGFAWSAERDRQKAASKEAVARGQQKVQIAVLLGEENDHRVNLTSNEKNTRAHLEEGISEQRIEREWIEFQIALREEREQQERAKKVPFAQIATQQMLHRADIADKETENRISFFSGFAASMNKAKEAEKARITKEKLESDRKKAAERARVFEERTRKSKADKSERFQVIDTPTAESKAPQTGGWLSGWFSKS